MDAARQVVDEWHRRLNERDRDGMGELVAARVEISGPRGGDHGSRSDVREWVEQSGIRLESRQIYASGDAVVVEQAARWPDPDGDGLTEPRTVFTAFQVTDGQITRILRFDTLAAALEVSGLDEQHVVPGPLRC